MCVSDFRQHTSWVCFHTVPCFFNLFWTPPGLTRKGITTDLGYTCPTECKCVCAFACLWVCVFVRALLGFLILTRISSIFSFHQFSDGSPNMSEIKSGQAAPCADVCPAKPAFCPTRFEVVETSLDKGQHPRPWVVTIIRLCPKIGSGASWSSKSFS